MPQPPDWKRYLEAGMQVTEFRRSQARALAGDLVSTRPTRPRPGASAVDEMVAMSRRRTEQLQGIVRSEVQRQLGSVGLATQADLPAPRAEAERGREEDRRSSPPSRRRSRRRPRPPGRKQRRVRRRRAERPSCAGGSMPSSSGAGWRRAGPSRSKRSPPGRVSVGRRARDAARPARSAPTSRSPSSAPAAQFVSRGA